VVKSLVDETERFLDVMGSSGVFVLARIPCPDGDPVEVRLIRRKDGSGFAMTVKRGEAGLLSDYWPAYEHGSWFVSDLTDKDGRVTTIRGLSPERVAQYVHEDAKKAGVEVDRLALAEAISDEMMLRMSAVADVLLS